MGMGSILDNLTFNLWDGTHHFHPVTKKCAVKLLTALLAKAQASLEAWEEYKDPYLNDTENEKEVSSRKKAVAYLEKSLARVKSSEENQAWTLMYQDYQSKVVLRKVKEAW